MSLEAEKSVIGAVLLDNAAYYEAELTAADFANVAHQHIWTFIQQLSEADSPIDLVTLTIKAKDHGGLELCGGSSYLAELLDFVPTAANITYYVKAVKSSSAKRTIRNLGQKLQECAGEEDAMEMVEATLFRFASDSKAVSLGDMARSSMKTYEERYNRGRGLAGISYGYDWLDYKTGGICKEQLIILAGRPSMGKTAFALNIAQRSKAKVYFASLETSKQSITDRFFSQQTRIDLNRFKNGKFDDKDFHEIADAALKMQESGIYIDDTPAISVAKLKQRCRRHKIKYGLDFIVIDYLQLMTAKAENRFQEVSLISRQLKSLAKEVAPIIALAQLSRNGAGDRAQVENLRESGQIEQDADLILFPYRAAANCEKCKAKNKDCGESHFNMADLTIAKQKDGPLGRMDMYWTGRYQSFEQVHKEA